MLVCAFLCPARKSFPQLLPKCPIVVGALCTAHNSDVSFCKHVLCARRHERASVDAAAVAAAAAAAAAETAAAAAAAASATAAAAAAAAKPADLAPSCKAASLNNQTTVGSLASICGQLRKHSPALLFHQACVAAPAGLLLHASGDSAPHACSAACPTAQPWCITRTGGLQAALQAPRGRQAMLQQKEAALAAGMARLAARERQGAAEVQAQRARREAAAREAAAAEAMRVAEVKARKEARKAARAAAARGASERPARPQESERRGDGGAASMAPTGALVRPGMPWRSRLCCGPAEDVAQALEGGQGKGFMPFRFPASGIAFFCNIFF